MIVLHGDPEYYKRKKNEYLAYTTSYAVRYYAELYKRRLIKKQYSYDEVYMLCQAEFLALCSFFENVEYNGRIETKNIQAYETLLQVVRLGIQNDIGIRN